MITDKLVNINNYSDIPQIVKDFVVNLKSDIALGRITLSDSVFVNIETYNTKDEINAKFEAHQKYIDIQIILKGQEIIAYTDKSFLTENKPYNEENDIVFYSESIVSYPKICLDGTNFIMLFPHEAHAPQISIGKNTDNVKKVVIKIKV